MDLVLDVERRADDRIVLLDDDFLLVGACASERGQRVTAALASSNEHARTHTHARERRAVSWCGARRRSQEERREVPRCIPKNFSFNRSDHDFLVFLALRLPLDDDLEACNIGAVCCGALAGMGGCSSG